MKAIILVVGLLCGHCLGNVVNDDIKSIVKSVNKEPIEEIAAKHLVFDKNFRNAVKFLKGSGFKELVKQAETKPEFNATLQYLQDNGLDTDNIIPWHKLQLFVSDIKEYNGVDTFNDFLGEVMNVLPKPSIQEQIKSYRSKDKEFDNFFQAIKSDEFRSLVNNARVSCLLVMCFSSHAMCVFQKASSLQGEIRVLSENGIAIDQLIEYLFTIIAWG